MKRTGIDIPRPGEVQRDGNVAGANQMMAPPIPTPTDDYAYGHRPTNQMGPLPKPTLAGAGINAAAEHPVEERAREENVGGSKVRLEEARPDAGGQAANASGDAEIGTPP